MQSAIAFSLRVLSEERQDEMRVSTSGPMKTVFQFRSSNFNTSVPYDYFINPSCFGDDLALWIIEKLHQKGIVTGATPEQEDFGWYVTYIVNSLEYCVLVGFQPNDVAKGDCWIGEIERHRGFLGSLLGGRHRGIDTEAVEIIDSIFKSAPEILDLEWRYRD